MLKKFFAGLVCLLLILPLSGCSEEPGVFDWLSWYFNRGSGMPTYSGTVTTSVENEVDIYYDDYGVPHIYAENMTDVSFAQGYAQANDRLFQMDLMRRMVSGRLTEVVGGSQEELVEDDVFHRVVGFRRAAKENLEVLSDSTLEKLEAFADGVNAYIEENEDELPPEFILFDYTPEEWTPVDSMVISKLIAWGLSGNMGTELFLYSLAAEIGEDSEKFEDILPSYLDYGPTVVDEEALEEIDFDADNASAMEKDPLPERDPDGAAELLKAFQRSTWGNDNMGVGSNNWVISGEHTESGNPLLASDMHLPMDLPSIWYENHLIVPGEANVTGVMFPGVPGVVAGHNEHIAWAETNLGPDVMDLYEIKFNDEEPHKYLYDDEWVEAEIIEEVVEVRGGEDIELEIPVTRHGPVISEAVEMDTPLSLKWTGLEGTPKADALMGIMQATDFEEFREALSDWWVPAQNFVYADREGNIGYLGNGKFPIRSEAHEEAGNGLLPVPGWSSDYEWEGFVDMDEIPYLYNPPEGMIVTANERIVDDSYPYHVTYEWAHPSRGMAIRKELEDREYYTLEDMKEIQASFYNYQAKKLIPELVNSLEEAAPEMGENEQEALVIMDEWGEEPREEVDSAGAAIFWRFYSFFVNNILVEQVPEDLEDMIFDYAPLNVIDQKILSGESAWIEDFDAAVKDTFEQTVEDLSREMGSNLENWEWGEIHEITLKHHIGEDVSSRHYNRGPFPIGGSLSTPANMGFFPTEETPFEVWASAPYRYVVDITEHKGYDSLAIGNSGHADSEHYDDQLDMWLNMEYKEMLYDRDEIEDTDRILTLEPK